MKCFFEKYYSHKDIEDKYKTKLAVVGGFFQNKPICAYCLAKLGYLTDMYGADDGVTNNSTPDTYVKDSKYVNVGAFYSKYELIKRFHFEEALEGRLLSELKSALKYKLSELEAQPSPIQPNIDRIIKQIKYEELEALDSER